MQSPKLSLSLHAMLGDNEQLQLPASSGEDSEEDSGTNVGKKNFQPYHATSVPKSENLEAHANERAAKGVAVTTMMLRNIPNKYTQNTLMQEINDFGYAGTYDFFYLPMDVHNRSNVGYAFINFEKPDDADRFHRSFADHRFQRFHSRKIGSVCVAHVQGLDANLRHFENRAVTQARNDQYRPVVLQGNCRIDFEEAVAQAKARGLAEPVPQAHHSRSGEAAKSAPNGGRVAQHQQQGKRPQNSKQQHQPRPQAMNAKEPKAPAVAKVAPPSQEFGRHGLEAAIRELLTTTAVHQPEAQQSQNGYRGNEAEGAVSGTPDIAQLQSLRSLLVDRLLEKTETQQQAPHSSDAAQVHPCGLTLPPWLGDAQGANYKAPSAGTAIAPDAPAYVNLSPSMLPGPKSKFAEFYDGHYLAEESTPRTNHAFLGFNLNNQAPNDIWRSL